MKNYLYHATIFASMMLAVSCDDMLDMQPETNPSDAVVWNSAASFEKEVNNYYSFLPYFQDKTNKRGIADRESMSDIVLSEDTENGYSNSTYTAPETDNFYEEYFNNLRSINYFFKNREGYADKDEIKQYYAEALFFRAYISFRMFKDYGPLTIVKDVIETSSPELFAARATRDEFADFIIGDLEEAINTGALPVQKKIVSTDQNGRITIGAARALLAEVCLFEGTWQKYHFQNTERSNALLTKAATYAEQVMNDDSYQLFYDEKLGVDSYHYMFTLESLSKTNPAGVLKETNKEYILRNRFHETKRQLGQNTVHAFQMTNMTRKFVEMFLDKNGQASKPDYKTSLNSYYKDRDPRLSTLAFSVGDLRWSYESASNFERNAADSAKAIFTKWNGCGFYVKKYATERAMSPTESGMDVPIIRLAEVYLIYAEAKCELDNGAISDADLDKSLNRLRDRVLMPHLTNATVPDGSTLLEEIRKERTRELYLEGFRFDDVRRWKTAEKEMGGNLEGVYIGTGSAFAKDWTLTSPYGQADIIYLAANNTQRSMSADGYAIREAASRRTFAKRNYLLPLPTKQIGLNPQLKNNEGW